MNNLDLDQLSQTLMHKHVAVTLTHSHTILEGVWDRTEINTANASRRIILQEESVEIAIPVQTIENIEGK